MENEDKQEYRSNQLSDHNGFGVILLVKTHTIFYNDRKKLIFHFGGLSEGYNWIGRKNTMLNFVSKLNFFNNSVIYAYFFTKLSIPT